MRHLLLLVMVFYGINSSSQVINASVEERSRYMMYTSKRGLKGKEGFEDGNNIIQIEKSGTKFQVAYTVRLDGLKHAVIIRKVDHDGKEITINKLEGGDKVFGPIPTESIEFNGKILLFYYKYIDKVSMKLYVSEVDRGNLQLVNTNELFSYQQDNVGMFRLGKAVSREISLSVSEDGSKLLAVAPGNNEDLFSCVFDNNLHIVRKKTSKLTGTEGLKISEVYLDNSGNNAIVLSKDRESTKTFNNTIAKKILIQKLNNSERLTDLENWGTEAEFRNAHFQASKDQSKIYVFGDYSGVVANAGVWLAEIPTDKLNPTKPKTFPYTEEYKKQMYDIGFGLRKRGDYGILDAELQLAEFENGDIAICGSPLWEQEIKHTDHSNFFFYAGPVMTVFLKEKNQSVFGMIPRYQWYCGGSKSIFIPYQDKLVVLYNDVAKNINGSTDPEDFRMRGSTRFRELSLAAAILNKDGSIQSKKLLAEGITRMNFYNTSYCEFLPDKKMLIPSASIEKKSDEQKIAIVTIE